MAAKEVTKKSQENGWTFQRVKGSHHIFFKEGSRSIPVPVHGNGCRGDLNAVLEVDIARDFDFSEPTYTGGYPVQVAPNIEFSMQLQKYAAFALKLK